MPPSSPGNRRSTLGGVPPMPAEPYLEECTTVRVRFNEVDALGVAWHGHYVNYFEEGRRAFGRRYGIDYPVFLEHRVPVPLVQMQVDYFAPARLSDTLKVTARLIKSDAARLTFFYEVRRESDGELLATGRTVQVFTSPAGELCLVWPDFMLERLKTWEPLWVK